VRLIGGEALARIVLLADPGPGRIIDFQIHDPVGKSAARVGDGRSDGRSCPRGDGGRRRTVVGAVEGGRRTRGFCQDK